MSTLHGLQRAKGTSYAGKRLHMVEIYVLILVLSLLYIHFMFMVSIYLLSYPKLLCFFFIQQYTRTSDHNLVDGGLADVVISPFLPEILDLFDSASSTTHHRPRLFLLLQDVKARLRASYNYLHGQNIFSGSHLEFISSNHILANDYLVRILSGKWDVVAHPPESLTQEDLHIAVQELQTKFSVGVMRHVQPYLEHMVDLLGWQPTQPGAENIVGCMFPTAAYDEAHPPSYPQSKPPDETAMETQMREIIRNRNSWDMRLLEIFVQRWDDGVFA